jgi:hypothetical protein
MTGRNGEVSGSSAQNLKAILKALSEIEKTLVASDSPVAAEHVAAAKRTIEQQR